MEAVVDLLDSMYYLQYAGIADRYCDIIRRCLILEDTTNISLSL